MTRARDLRPGDVIKIGGRKVTVTHYPELEARGWSIRWARRESTGTSTRVAPGADVQRIYRKPGWRW